MVDISITTLHSSSLYTLPGEQPVVNIGHGFWWALEQFWTGGERNTCANKRTLLLCEIHTI
jgi:hypothetical protein